MNAKKFSDAMSELDTKYVDEALDYQKKVKKPSWIKWGTLAACFTIIIVAAVSVLPNYLNQQGATVALSDGSTNVVVRYIDEAPMIKTSLDLQLLTEEEVFSTSDMAIFRGIVLEIKNIEVDFNGNKEYRAIAQIEVEEVFQGSCEAGETVSVLLPCPISEETWVEDTDVVSAIKIGMTGIFMPVLYNDENSIWEQNHARLVKKDIAEYGFLDGLQYAFLETDSGLVFSRETYQSIADVTTLNEVEEYIQTMLQR